VNARGPRLKRRLYFMVPFPDEDYLLALGRLSYAVSYLEWTVLGDLPRVSGLPPELQLRALVGNTTGAMGRRMGDARLLAKVADPKVRAWLEAAGEHLVEVAARRNSVLHARPATVEGRQRLHRWDPTRGEFYTVTDQLLEEILVDIKERIGNLGTLRIAYS
jgi:hypothetical protein